MCLDEFQLFVWYLLVGFGCISCCNSQTCTHTQPAAVQTTAPSCEILHVLPCLPYILYHNLLINEHASFFLLLFWNQIVLFLAPKLLNSYHVWLHPSELPSHMCTLRVCVHLRAFFAHAFVFLCESNEQYNMCVHVALTRHCVVFATVNWITVRARVCERES